MNKDVEISLPECAFNSLGTASKVELLDHKVLTFLYRVMGKMFTYWGMGKSFWLIHGSGCTVCELRQSVQLSQHIFNPEVKNICFEDKNEELPSHGIHVNTPWKIMFPSQTPGSCYLTVYVLSCSFWNFKEYTLSCWCMCFVWMRYKIVVQWSSSSELSERASPRL